MKTKPLNAAFLTGENMTEAKKQNRRYERELALRAVFQIEFHQDARDLQKGIAAVIDSDAGFEHDHGSGGYAAYLVDVVVDHLTAIDERIAQYLRKDWRMDRLPGAEKAILRVATAEMCYLDQPLEIAINEAVELAKRYCDEDAPRYINGILNNLGHHLAVGYSEEVSSYDSGN
ncbi:transcription antitermination factor NusB [Pseudoramibacter faecis]|uniref:transcription antitermination factor NusB n=1 Tax=Pseudoramibacter faecis TaxID=3108534 RepID=UPI002E77E2D0|nr:transcription antitermination factor NusB [Pseudoramibacter sp. HA2172]